jgi:hypothetical protein
MSSVERQCLFGKYEHLGYNVNPTVADTNGWRARNVKYSPNGQLWRKAPASTLRRPTEAGVVELYNPQLSFESGLHGLAAHVIDVNTVPPQFRALESCGWESGAFAFSSYELRWNPAAAKSYWWERWFAGRLAKLGGCRGNVDWELVPRMPVKMSWTWEGCDQNETASAPVGDPDFTYWGPEMICRNASFQPWGDSIGAGEYGRIAKVQIQSRTQIYRQLDVNATTGLAEVVIPGRGASEDDMGIQVVLDVEQFDDGSSPGTAGEDTWIRRWRDRTDGDPGVSITIVNPAAGGIAAQSLYMWLGKLSIIKDPEDIVLGSGVVGHRITCSVLSTEPTDGTEDDFYLTWTQGA